MLSNVSKLVYTSMLYMFESKEMGKYKIGSTSYKGCCNCNIAHSLGTRCDSQRNSGLTNKGPLNVFKYWMLKCQKLLKWNCWMSEVVKMSERGV
jgi:hypothetical protein